MSDSKESFDSKDFLQSVTSLPGIYQMLDKSGTVIYVGKAKNLKKRISSYFRATGLTTKTISMVSQICDIHVVTTRTESEALLLENDLIKNLNPKYNILFRDDKSYAYICLTKHQYPRLIFYRGKVNPKKGVFFGPFPSSAAIRYSINHIQKLFKLRTCEDSVFGNRSRPCLQYQIKRCTAPCVGFIEGQNYLEKIKQTELFLNGKSEDLINQQVSKMEQDAKVLNYEAAAESRDIIEQLRKISEKQFVTGFSDNLDIIACYTQDQMFCIQLFKFRAGQSYGNKPFIQKNRLEQKEGEIIERFLLQHYAKQQVPQQLLISHPLVNEELVVNYLTSLSNKKVLLNHSAKGKKKVALEMAQRNAKETLSHHFVSKSNLSDRYKALIEDLQLLDLPKKIECFDISHTRGEATKASCVVFNVDGAVKSEYRRYNIIDITAGDDYAAMAQVLSRRYEKRLETPEQIPDLILIDGGKGQISTSMKVFNQLSIFEIKPNLRVIGVSKGPSRKEGYEDIIDEAGQIIPVALESSSRLLIQTIRDEAHRFAITGHRQARQKNRRHSKLEDIPGIGTKRRQLLLKKFGGIQGVINAGVEELVQLKGINKETAQSIYDNFHG
ncbi:MAG: excinuclease ABC subunit UvrC [Gammaproteobacteria bacterium]|nr:excinuclease ABC subunit UvrC [Gammaproteobacteria bacterium]